MLSLQVATLPLSLLSGGAFAAAPPGGRGNLSGTSRMVFGQTAIRKLQERHCSALPLQTLVGLKPARAGLCRPIPSSLDNQTGDFTGCLSLPSCIVTGTNIQPLLEGPGSLGGACFPSLGNAAPSFGSSIDQPLTLFLFPFEGEQQVLVARVLFRLARGRHPSLSTPLLTMSRL